MHCYGCGQELQTNDENLPGYVPDKILNNKENILCQRCFRLQHYNTNSEIEIMDEEYVKILKTITKEDALIVYILDIFNFEASIIENLQSYINDKKVIILINKRDLLDKDIKDEKIKKWVIKRLLEEKIKVEEVIISSGMTNYNIDLIIDKINELRNKKDVYIIGNSNVGKSTFINSLLKNYSNETDNLITTSAFPGTTLNVIQIPLDDDSYIYDTPGIIAKNIIWNSIEPKLLKHLMPKKEIKPVTFQLKPKQSLILGGLAIFDFINGSETGFTCYFSNFINITRSKFEKAENTFNSLVKIENIRPTSNLIKSTNDLVVKRIDIKNEKRIDIVIRGLGWISFVGKDFEVGLHLPKKVSYHIREALI